MKRTYDISFVDALQHIIDGGAVKGDNFRKGYFLKTNIYGQLVLVNCNDFYKEDAWVSIRSLSKQKFRKLTVMTPKELSI